MLSTEKIHYYLRPKMKVARALTALWLILFCIASLAQTPTSATHIIDIEHLDNSVADQSQVFTVQITEGRSIEQASLFYRRQGGLSYQETPMLPLGNTGYYSVSVPTDPSDLRSIEYYIRARDMQGNITNSGFDFNPYSRHLKPALSPLEQPTTSPVLSPTVPSDSGSPSLLSQRWVQITLGVLAAGLLASVANSGGEDTSKVNVTFTAQ